ncbi:MAG: hypothetical protein HY366_00565 [Candidatus Aenigmarchaeota archaeon]|nr:hypothetical protein [Candidatus Aenigmarchaeota archaeon]
MARLETVTIVLIGLGLLVWGILSQAGASPTGIGDTISERTREILGGESSDLLARNITVSGAFSLTKLDLGNAPVGLLMLDYSNSEVDVTINGVRVTSDDVKMIIEQYEGAYAIEGRRLTLDGTAHKVRVNGVTLDTGSATVKVKTAGLIIDSLDSKSVDVRSFKVASLAGKLNLQDRVTLTLQSEPLEMTAFLGTVRIDESLYIEGKARRVFASGQDFRTVVS